MKPEAGSNTHAGRHSTLPHAHTAKALRTAKGGSEDKAKTGSASLSWCQDPTQLLAAVRHGSCLHTQGSLRVARGLG